MRILRSLTLASAFALPALAGAQDGRPFKDAWFWGLKAGSFTLADSGGRYTQAPMIGFDWMITRTHGGLYLSASQAFFNQQTLALRDPDFGADSGLRVINLTNLRRFDAAVMVFPGENPRWHPYAGLGFTLNAIADAVGQPPFATADQLTFTNQLIQSEKVSFSPLGIVGAQYRFPDISVFGQATINATQHTFLLYNGQPVNLSFEIGLRYNIGSSIDRNDP